MVILHYRLLESIYSAAHITQAAVKSLIAFQSAQEHVIRKLAFDFEELYGSSRSTATHSAVVLLPGESKVVTVVNSLTHSRTQLICIKVRTLKVMVSFCVYVLFI